MDIKALKERKKALKLSTSDIACLIDVPYGTLSKIFTGETKAPSYITIEKIEQALSKIEQERRIKAYQDAIAEYINKHSDEEFDIKKFEEKYRKEHHLSPDPIPFAVPTESGVEGNLALNAAGMTVEQFARIETDRNTELIDGRLITAEMPSFEHQALIDELGNVIRKFIDEQGGNCKVHTAGMNLRLDESDQSVFVPDLMVRCKFGKATKQGILGAPDWIIEVTSPSTRKRDYRIKYTKYLDAGVHEYWVVDLQKHIVATYINDLPAITGLYQFEDEVPVFIYDNELKIRISDLLTVI